MPKVLNELPDHGAGWTVHYTLFARAGFTEAAAAEAQQHGALLVDLEALVPLQGGLELSDSDFIESRSIYQNHSGGVQARG